MLEKETVERAKEAKRKGKSPSSQAGEFVRDEMHHIREGKHTIYWKGDDLWQPE